MGKRLYRYYLSHIYNQVEQVMNVGVIFADTIKRYKQDKCSNTSSSTCLHNVFNGEEYFNEYILNHPGNGSNDMTRVHRLSTQTPSSRCSKTRTPPRTGASPRPPRGRAAA